MPSIYNIDDYKTGYQYAENDIVYQKVNIGSTGIPKNVNYYYALKSFTNQSPPSSVPFNNQYWGGYTSVNGKQTPNFIWTASYNLSVSHNPKVNSVSFGNGYEQRNPDGLFTGLIKLDASFEMRSEKEASAIIHFLKSRKGVESFTILNLPPIYADGAYKKRFICPSFNTNFTFHNNYSVKASFVETNSEN